jgi:hypothetical protein
MNTETEKIHKHLTLRITKEILANSERNSLSHCAVADALRYQKGASSIAITADSVRFNIGKTRYMTRLPADAAAAIFSFDAGKPVKPFTLRLQQLFSQPVAFYGKRTKTSGYKQRPKHRACNLIRRFHGVRVIAGKGGTTHV